MFIVLDRQKPGTPLEVRCQCEVDICRLERSRLPYSICRGEAVFNSTFVVNVRVTSSFSIRVGYVFYLMPTSHRTPKGVTGSLSVEN